MSNRFVLILVFVMSMAPNVVAQDIIPFSPSKKSKGTGLGSYTYASDMTDTLHVGSTMVERWSRFTKKFGKDYRFGLFFTLPVLDHPYRITSWNFPIYGGAASSGGLQEASIGATLWMGADSISDLHPDSSDASSASATFRAGAYQYTEASFPFSGIQPIRSSTTVALEAFYASGPDSGAVSPIWTDERRINPYFFGRPELEKDSTTVIVRYVHDDFWKLYASNPGVFGEIAGYLIVEMDSTSDSSPDDDRKPFNTSLKEKWYLPGGHDVVSNYPNPFNPTTTIRVMPQRTGLHTLTIRDLLGRVLVEESFHAMQGNELGWVWNATGIASGVYQVSVTAGSDRWFHTVTLVK